MGDLDLPTFQIFYYIKNSSHRRQATICAGPQPDLHYAHFLHDDVDFEIEIENKSHDRSARVVIQAQDKNFIYILLQNSTQILTTLKSNGGQLHFCSQASEDGESMVCLAAQRHQVNLNQAAMMVSQLKFTVTFSVLSPPFMVTIQELNGRILDLQVSASDTIESLKSKIWDLIGVQLYDQILQYQGQNLERGQLQDFNLRNGSIITFNRKSKMAESFNLMGGSENGAMSRSRGVQHPRVCTDGIARGVVCMGEKTSQVFKTAPFSPDYNLVGLKPFIIEMRMAPRYSLIN